MPGQQLAQKRNDSEISRFGTYTTYDNMKFVANVCAEKLHMYDAFKSFAEWHGDFLDQTVPNEVFWSNCKLAVKACLEVSDAHTEKVISLITLVVLEFMVPLIEPEEHGHGPFMFGADAEKLIGLLNAPLSGSVLARKAQKIAASGIQTKTIKKDD